MIYKNRQYFDKILLFLAILVLVVLTQHIKLQLFASRVPQVQGAHIKLVTSSQTDLSHKKLDSMEIPILMYHYVEYVQDPKDTIRKSLDITPDIFENQIKTLVAAGYTFLTPNQIPDILVGRQPLPNKPVILSFDDGYRDFYTGAFPILEKYKVKAVAYIVPGFINKPNNLTSDQLEKIAQSGLVEIGGHTMDHAYLKGLSASKDRYQITQGKLVLEDMIHQKVVSFAYPYGAFDSQAEAIVKSSGYETAVTTLPGVTISNNNLFLLYRIRPAHLEGQSLLNFLNEEVNHKRRISKL